MVRRVAIIVASGLCLTLSMAGQFKWNWKQAQELSWHESLKASKLSQAEKVVIKHALVKSIAAELSNDDVSDTEIDKTVLDTRIQMVDLNGDRTPEVIAQGSSDKFCSPTGNCPLWILQKSGGQYKLLLTGYGQVFNIEKTSHEHFLDIVVGMHGSAFETTLRTYHFEDGHYQKDGCYEASFPQTGNGKSSKEPAIVPCK